MKREGTIHGATRPTEETGTGTLPVRNWYLRPVYKTRSRIPFQRIMRIVGEGFAAGLPDQDLARDLRTAIERNDLLTESIDADAPLSGGPLALPGLTFEDWSAWRLSVSRPGEPDSDATWRIPVSRLADGSWRPLLSTVEGENPLAVRSTLSPSAAGCVALTRREHASIELSSPDGARVIIDPIFRSRLLGCVTAMPVPEPGIAAAFVTHSHSDHFDLATLDYLASGGAAVYVPQVPRHSLLSEDMYRALQLCGLPSQTCEWGSLTQIGDITVEALPFFGEQASALVLPPQADTRNWGNCYRIDTADFSALVLTDSGADPTGSMLGTISESVRRRGPIDVVVGSLRHLYMPFQVEGLQCNFVVLPVAGLRTDHDLWQRGKIPSSTLGISGTAAACAAARARVFLPYAHGLTGYGQPIAENPFGPGTGLDEAAACRALSEELKRIGCGTVVASWNPGDSWTPASAG